MDSLVDFFRRDSAALILAFILLYKIGDTMAAAITTPLNLSSSWVFPSPRSARCETLSALGPRLPEPSPRDAHAAARHSAQFVGFGVLQAVSTAGFAFLAPHRLQPSCAFRSDAFRERQRRHSGMGTSAFVAFMASRQ